MYVVEMIYYPPEGHFSPEKVGWAVAMTKVEEFKAEDEADFHIVPDSETKRFVAWWRERHYSVCSCDEFSMFQVTDDLAREVRTVWLEESEQEATEEGFRPKLFEVGNYDDGSMWFSITTLEDHPTLDEIDEAVVIVPVEHVPAFRQWWEDRDYSLPVEDEQAHFPIDPEFASEIESVWTEDRLAVEKPKAHLP